MTDGELRKLAQDAAGIVTNGRDEAYGKPEDSFLAIAALWQGYENAKRSIGTQGVETKEDVARRMELLKMARRMTAEKPNLDSYVDGIGYILCEARITIDDGAGA